MRLSFPAAAPITNKGVNNVRALLVHDFNRLAVVREV